MPTYYGSSGPVGGSECGGEVHNGHRDYPDQVRNPAASQAKENKPAPKEPVPKKRTLASIISDFFFG